MAEATENVVTPVVVAEKPAPVAPLVESKTAWEVFETILKPVASLKLTVVLMAMGIFLVFCGTLAQIDAGIYYIERRYFHALFAWIPFQIFFPRDWNVHFGFPFPGGWTIGGLLLLNLVAAHTVRFKLTWKRLGIFAIHLGLILLLLGELVRGVAAIEGNIDIDEGSWSNHTYDTNRIELAIIDPADPETDEVVVVPGSFLAPGKQIRHEELPFDIEVKSYFKNSSLKRVRRGDENQADRGDGLLLSAVEEEQVSGAEADQLDVPSAYIEIKDKNGTTLGNHLVSLWFTRFLRHQPRFYPKSAPFPQTVSVDGKVYELFLRYARTYKPYRLELIDFTHERYPGTQIPKDFSSLVRLVDESRGEDREVLIWMNHPLRYQGETFFQSSFKPDDSGTVLHVVRNPGWYMPYISCTLVAVGLLAHFGIKLWSFLEREITA